MSVKMRIEVERKIVTAVVEDAIAAGCDLQVYADGEDLTDRTTNPQVVIDMLMDLEDAFLKMRLPATKDGFHDHWVRFVFGNDGWDVISDYLTSLDKTTILTRALTISKQYED